MLSITEQAVNYMWDAMQRNEWSECKLWFEIVCIDCRSRKEEKLNVDLKYMVMITVTYLLNNTPSGKYHEEKIQLRV